MSSFEVRVLIEVAAERIDGKDDRSTTTDETGMFDPLDLISSMTLLILVCDREAKTKSAGLCAAMAKDMGSLRLSGLTPTTRTEEWFSVFREN